jgi:hypothetical protein
MIGIDNSIKVSFTDPHEGNPTVKKWIVDIFKFEWERIWSDCFKKKLNTQWMWFVNYIIVRYVITATTNFDAMASSLHPKHFCPAQKDGVTSSVLLLVCWRLYK